MKKILFALFVLPVFCFSQSNPLMDIATGEYSQQYIKSDGTVYVPVNTVYDATWVVQKTSMAHIAAGDGGQYTSVFLDSSGNVFSCPGQGTTVTAYATDNNNASFTGISKVYAMWGMIVAIKAGQVWYWSFTNAGVGAQEDMLLQFSSTMSNGVPKPRILIQPPSKTIVRMFMGSGISPYGGARLWGLASDSTLWQWDQSHTTPFQVTGKSGFAGTWTGKVVDAALGPDVSMVVTSTNQVWVWGFDALDYGGHSDWANAPMDSINQNMTGAGMVFPLKQIVGNYLCVQAIDANNNKFGIGNNQTGSLGSGFMAPSWNTNWNGTSSNVGNYDFVHTDGLQATWLQTPGKFLKIKTTGSFVFYSWVQDMAGNWYAYGRNKAESLGQGLTYHVADQANYPDWYDIPGPRPANPITQTWTIAPAVNTSSSRPPWANAGVNQYLGSGVTSTTLIGQASEQQQPTGSTTITMTNIWTKISGPACTITSPTSQNTTVTGMTSGIYVFQNKVTNSNSVSDSQRVTIQLSPTSNAGPDQTITLPISSVLLDGTSSTGAVSYAWSQTSGPNTANLVTPTGSTTTANGLIAGSYVFQLAINGGSSGALIDPVTITVNPAVNTSKCNVPCIIINR